MQSMTVMIDESRAKVDHKSRAKVRRSRAKVTAPSVTSNATQHRMVSSRGRTMEDVLVLLASDAI